MIVQEQVNVEARTREAGKRLAKFVSDIKSAVKSGRPVEEAIAIGAAVVSDLIPLVGLIPDLKTEFAEDMGAEATTILLIGSDLVKALVS